MKKQPINCSWPATLSNLSTDNAQENFTRGKLKVFYKGETADHRYFSDEFSEELIKSLPYTPVVSYYDEDKDDFVGHATEQQILGIVDPCIDPSFEEDKDGITWCICDVVLYTERPDKVGDIAKKIEGHSQSLELDPRSVKYTINYDSKRHFKNIEFTAGTFIGVSVLGKDQKPAFTGSEFFTSNEAFMAKMKILKNYCERKTDQVDHGGSEMNLQEFMKLSWGDISSKVDEALIKEYGNEAYTLIVDMFDDNAIVRWYSYIDSTSKLMRVKYSCNEQGEISLGDVNEVRISYEDVLTPSTAMTDEIGIEQVEVTTEHTTAEATEISDVNADVTNDIENAKCGESDKKDVEDAKCGDDKKKLESVEDPNDSKPDDKPEESKDPKDPEDKKDDSEKSEGKSDMSTDAAENSTAANTEAAQVTNAEVTENTTTEVSVENEEPKSKEESSSSASFTESERAEFESLKREKKVTLINSFKANLSEEDFNSFMDSVDTLSEEELELQLLKLYKRNTEEVVKEKRSRVFTFDPILKTNVKENSLDSWVKKNL